MSRSSNQYVFVTNWKVKASAKEVYTILYDILELPRWWPSVYLDIKKFTHPTKGECSELYTKGFLPYTLRWKLQVIEEKFPYRLGIKAFGDFTGNGLWTLKEEGEYCLIRYDWKVEAEKPILKYLSFLMKPIFTSNHEWAMKKGEESLKLELIRKRLPKGKKCEVNIPSPPTFPHNLMNNRIFNK
jgi:hypothetical protein